MKAYVDWALRRYYGYLVPYWERARMEKKSMFICFEDWMNSSRRDELYNQALQFLYPGGGSDRARWTKKIYGSNNTSDNNPTTPTEATTAAVVEYDGGHSTDHNPELRDRLVKLIRQLDAEVFNFTVEKSNDVFGCGNA